MLATKNMRTSLNSIDKQMKKAIQIFNSSTGYFVSTNTKEGLKMLDYPDLTVTLTEKSFDCYYENEEVHVHSQEIEDIKFDRIGESMTIIVFYLENGDSVSLQCFHD